jgi:hypothetical protein
MKLGKHTRVVERTLHRRGKSFTPESSVVIELSSICRDDCSDVTEEDSEAAMVIEIIVVLKVIVYNPVGIDRAVKAA